MFECVKNSNVKNIMTANKQRMPVAGEGNILLKVCQNENVKQILLTNALYVPDLAANLIAVKPLTQKGFYAVFQESDYKIFDSKDNEILCASSVNSVLYELVLDKSKQSDFKKTENLNVQCNNVNVETGCLAVDICIWHKRLGHLNYRYMNELKNKAGFGINFNETSLPTCESCIYGKLSKKSFPPNPERATEKLELVHTDLCNYEIVCFLHAKTEVTEKFIQFLKFVETQSEKRIKRLRSDNGTEFTCKKFQNIILQNGIKHETIIPGNPQQNGRSERVNRILLDKARCLVAEAKLPKNFWGEAIGTSAYLSNRSPKRVLNQKTPFEMWNGFKITLTYFWIQSLSTYS